MTAERQKQLIDDAKQALEDRIIYEPRLFFDRIELNSTFEINGHPEVFRNGEAFPITLTHMTLWANDNPADDNASDVQDLRRAIQQNTLQLSYHEQVFPSTPAVLPLFANKVVASGNVKGLTDAEESVNIPRVQWTSGWDFAQYDKPFVLMARQSIQLDLSFSGTLAGTATFAFTVSFFGVGMLTGRDYMFSETFLFGDDANQRGTRFVTSSRSYRNDGMEPVLITDWVTSAPGNAQAGSGSGGGHRFHISCNARIVGGSTNAWWAHGPQLAVLGDTAPLTRSRDDVDRPAFDLLGVSSGHAIVHKFSAPLVWLPGDGLDHITLQKLQDNAGLDQGDPIVDLALCGYITIA